MSRAAAADWAADASQPAEWDASEVFGKARGLKLKFMKFLNGLPEHYEDVDPAWFRRLPIPY